jgi:hypothetical protein
MKEKKIISNRNPFVNQIQIGANYYDLPNECASIVNHFSMVLKGLKSHGYLHTSDGKRVTIDRDYLIQSGYKFHPKSLNN